MLGLAVSLIGNSNENFCVKFLRNFTSNEAAIRAYVRRLAPSRAVSSFREKPPVQIVRVLLRIVVMAGVLESLEIGVPHLLHGPTHFAVLMVVIRPETVPEDVALTFHASGIPQSVVPSVELTEGTDRANSLLIGHGLQTLDKIRLHLQ